MDTLSKLDTVLAGIPPSPELSYGLNDPEYTRQFQQFDQSSTQQNLNINSVVQQAGKIVTSQKIVTFRTCSVGCGDGRFDKEVLLRTSREYPGLAIDYTGIDVNEFSCQTARERIRGIDNVQAKVIEAEFSTSTCRDIGSFDLIIFVKSLYYFPDIKSALVIAMDLLNSKGVVLIVSGDRIPLFELIHRFWLHQTGQEMRFTRPFVTDALENLNLKYHMSDNHALVDFTECFADDFQKPYHKCVLNFMAHANLEKYPPEVSKLCKEYLAKISHGKPKYLIDHDVNIILVEKQQPQN